MAITKTIQATVKNRTDTAANWTSKNPVLAEGEIIVVQTSAGETRLKIGDGVKTFTQLPYTDEQIYNNVVTSVNGQTGDITIKTAYQYAQDGGYTGTEEEFSEKLASGLMIIHVTDNNGTLSADTPFLEIKEAINAGIQVLVDYNGTILPLTAVETDALYFGTIMCVNDGTASAAASIMIEISQSDEVQDISAEIPGAQEPLIGSINDIAPSQVYQAVRAGRPVILNSEFRVYTAFSVLLFAVLSSIILDDVIYCLSTDGDNDTWKESKIRIPTKTSQLTNDSGFLTSHQDISGKQDKATLEADVAAKGFTKNTGTYSKPAGGIPKSDLDAAVQTSLGKADTALQEHQSLAAYRTAAAQDEIDSGKVDKVTGKGLSTNDYTASAKAKVDAIPANPKYTDTVYDDTALKERVATIEGKESAWDAKSDFSGSYNDLTDKPTIPTALPNPNAITFTGAVTGSYNGSEPVTINIPESGAGNMKKLTFTGAVTGEYDGTTDVSIDIPIATTSTAGTIKVGNGLSISADGTLSVTTATYYTGTADPVNTLGADNDLYLKKREDNK